MAIIRGKENVNDDLNGTNDADSIFGLSGNDVLRGLAGADALFGGKGDDDLLGANDNDELFGGDGNDALQGGTNADSLSGGSGNDILLGDADNDELFGGGGIDRLFGGDGADKLYAGAGGQDILTGGAGVDQFLLPSPDDTPPIVTDPEANEKFSVAQTPFILASGEILSLGDLDPARFTSGTTAGDENTNFIYNNQTGELLFDSDGIGSASPVVIAILSADPNTGLFPSIDSSNISIVADSDIPSFL